MAERAELPNFCYGSYPERALAFDDQRTINLYPVLGGNSSESQLMLFGTPGLKLALNLGLGPIRGIQRTQNYWYVVSRNSVYQIDRSLSVIQATGTLNTSSGKVSLAYNNNNQLAIVDGQNLYICTTGSLTPTLSTITVGINGKPSSVCFLNQYFIISILNTQQFQWSAINDGTSWSPTDADFVTSSPQNLIAVASANGYLYLLGTDITEVWANNPTQITIGPTTISFPFNFTTTVIPYGIASVHAVVNINDGLGWLTSTNLTSPHIIFTHGTQEIVLSTPAIEQFIASFGTIGNAYAMGSHQQGEETLIFSFPSANITLCYDFRTQLYHERSSYNNLVWLPIDIAAFGDNTEIAGDSTNGNVYYLDPNTYTDNGNPIVRTRISPHYESKHYQNTCYRLELEFEPGTALPSGQGSNPIANIECSTDYGHTYGNKRGAPMRLQGQYLKRLYWTRFGVGRDFQFRLTISEPIKICIIKAWAEFEEGIN
jgi:hypothetical protein